MIADAVQIRPIVAPDRATMAAITGIAIASAAEMRAAEAIAIKAGASVDSLMERAGRGVADSVQRLAAGSPVLILCGPGNNGGDGYVAASWLSACGLDVRVAASAPPATSAAAAAAARWAGPVASLDTAIAAPVMVDALFGTGLSRSIEPAIVEALLKLAARAALTIAVDLPSGAASDDGAMVNDAPDFDLTLALGAVKPAHLLQPAAEHCGAVRLIDIGVWVESATRVLDRPRLLSPGPDANKYSRGMVAVVAGAMPGAAELAASAAMRAGAGYVLLTGATAPQPPHAIVRVEWAPAVLDDPRVAAVLIGPGLGRGAAGAARLDAALDCGRPLVIDGDALHLLDDRRMERLRARREPAVLTPHAGEFAAVFGAFDRGKLVAARAAAATSGAVVVFKGADTVIASPDGKAVLAGNANPWLSTAGTGDVLAGTIAAMLAVPSRGAARGLDAAAAGVWLHRAAADRLGAALIADDLVDAVGVARAAIERSAG